jgi:hypothetical protein
MRSLVYKVHKPSNVQILALTSLPVELHLPGLPQALTPLNNHQLKIPLLVLVLVPDRVNPLLHLVPDKVNPLLRLATLNHLVPHPVLVLVQVLPVDRTEAPVPLHHQLAGPHSSPSDPP